jgi:hypothetical protein
VLGRDDGIVGSPDQQDRCLVCEVKAISGTHGLAAESDDASDRRQERFALGVMCTARSARFANSEARLVGSAVSDRNKLAPGSDAARSAGLTSSPSPPLETRTSRSIISGN